MKHLLKVKQKPKKGIIRAIKPFHSRLPADNMIHAQLSVRAETVLSLTRSHPNRSLRSVGSSGWAGGGHPSISPVVVQPSRGVVGMDSWMVMSFYMQHSGKHRGERGVINDVSQLISLLALRELKEHQVEQCGTCRQGFSSRNEMFGCWRFCRGLRGETGQKSMQSNRMLFWNIRAGTFPAPLLSDADTMSLLHSGGVCG